MFGRKAAAALDATASAANTIGDRIAGDRGANIADAVTAKVLAPVRRRIDVGCTCTDPTCTDR